MLNTILDSFEHIPPEILKKILSGVLWEGTPDCGKIAFTFDDGPDPEITPLVLDALSEYSATGTFFMLGKNVDKHADIAAEIVKKGHVTGNHSFNHPKMIFMKSDVIKSEIMETQKSIFNCTGVEPVYFRPPYGYFDIKCAKILKKLGFKLVLWTVLAGDYGEFTKDEVLKRVIPFIRSGAIIVFHDTKKCSGYDLPGIIRELCGIASSRNLEICGIDKLSFFNEMEVEKMNDSTD